MRKTSLLVLGLAWVVSADALATPVFTGHADTDFTDATTIVVPDPGGLDVGVPIAAPPGTISGWDIKEIKLFYEPSTDVMYVGFDTFGIAGDADGDGDPGSEGPALAGLGGFDPPDFGSTESFALLLDIDEDGQWDVIVGVSAGTDITGFTVASFVGDAIVPPLAFGAPLPQYTGELYASPSAAAPDLEFTITNFSSLPISSGVDDALSFAVNGFMGSFDDAGFGEDYAPGIGQPVQVCFDADEDGWDTCEGDCDDSDPLVFPGAVEVCNGVDDNCDGQIDEGPPECDDEDACTSGDACIAGSCQGTTAVPCEDGNDCTSDGCLTLTGCINTPMDGAGCDDGNACTSADLCVGVKCEGSQATSCDDGNPCTDDACAPATGCSNTPNGNPCTDGDACTTNDLCNAAAACAGQPITCDDGNPCTVELCDPAAGCGADPAPDGTECGLGQCGPVCAAGQCVQGANPSDYCSGVTEAGSCDGHTLTICVGGEVQVTDCLAEGKACGWNEVNFEGFGGFDCVSQDTTCDGVPDSGKCDGQVLTWCDTDNGVIHSYDCALEGLNCGWTGSYFCCHEPADCMPMCSGKACGDDGCGGECGQCEGDDLCTESGHCLPCDGAPPAGGPGGGEDPGAGGDPGAEVCQVSDGCGDLTAAGKCAGHDLMRCVSGIPVTVKCGTLGGVCGFNPATGFLGCVPQANPCDGVPTSGACDGAILTTCVAGQTVTTDCAQANLACEWTGEAYECAITDECAPQCSGVSCGTDGCGGSCGTCPDDEGCTASGRCLSCDPLSQADPLQRQDGDEPMPKDKEGIIELTPLDQEAPPDPSAGCGTSTPANAPAAPLAMLVLLSLLALTRRRMPAGRRPDGHHRSLP